MTARRSRTIVLLALALTASLVASACGGSTGSDRTSGGTEPSTSTAAASGTPSDATTDTSTDAPSGSDTDIAATSEPVVTVDPPTALVDVTTVDLIGPAPTGAAESPVFTWSPVDGATSYRLAVLGDSGVVWSWTGAGTEIRMGGYDEEPPAGFAGIRLLDPAWWSVVALDDDEAVLAISPLREVSPDERRAEPPTTELPIPPADPAPSTTAPAEAAPAGPPDPCGLLTVDELGQALGAPAGTPSGSAGGQGRYSNCTWLSTADEFDEISVSLNTDLSSYDPEGWTRGEIVPVDGLGEQSYISTDFGVRIGFVRRGLAVTVIALGRPGLDPAIGIDLARLVDQRLVADSPSPAPTASPSPSPTPDSEGASS